MLVFLTLSGVVSLSLATDTYRAALDSAKLHFDSGEYHKSLDFYDKALAYAGQNRSRRLRVLRSKGLAELNSSLIVQSIATLDSALVLAIDFGQAEALRDIHLNLSAAYQKIGRYTKSLWHLKQCRASCLELQDSLVLAYTDYSQGIIFKDQGLFDLSSEYLYRAIRHLDSTKGSRRQYSGALNSLGLLYTKTGDYALAERYLKEGLILRKELGYELGIGGSYNNLGLLYTAKGRLVAAKLYLDSALVVKSRSGFSVSAASTLSNIGDLYLMENDLAKADSCYSGAKRWRAISNSSSGKCMSYYDFGRLCRAKGEYSEARKVLLNGLRCCDSLAMLPLKADFLTELQVVCERQGNIDEAYRIVNEAIVVGDSLINRKKATTLSLLNIEFQTQQIEHQLLEQKQLLNISRLKHKNVRILTGVLALLLLMTVISGSAMVKIQQRKLKENHMRIQHLLYKLRFKADDYCVLEDKSDRLDEELKLKYQLSNQEYLIWKQLSTGKAQKDIAEEMFVTYDTVATHRKNLYRKLQLSSDLKIRKNVLATNLYRDELASFFQKEEG